MRTSSGTTTGMGHAASPPISGVLTNCPCNRRLAATTASGASPASGVTTTSDVAGSWEEGALGSTIPTIMPARISSHDD